MVIAPKVSILIPTYNREDYIGDCISSALGQDYPDFEIVIVDNASTDSTWEICQDFAKKDQRVRIFRNEKNLGPVRNWLRCFDEARGEISKILFSDDTMKPNFLTSGIEMLKNSKVGFVFSAANVGTEVSNSIVRYNWKPFSGVYDSNDFVFSALFFDDAEVPFSPGAGLFYTDDFKKNLLLDISSPTIKDFSEHGAGPDLLLYLLTANSYEKVGFISDPSCFFRSHEGSITISRGRNYVFSRYLQAKLFFCLQTDQKIVSNEKIKKFISKEWFRYCLKIESVSLREFMRRFVYGKMEISYGDIMLGFFKFLAIDVSGFIKRRIGSIYGS